MAKDATSSVERAVYIQRIDRDKKEEYLDAHENVPDDVSRVMRKAGATSFELYVRGDIAVCIVEAEDIDEYVQAAMNHPDNQRWERRVAQFKDEGVEIGAEDEQIPFMKRVWTLDSSTK